MFQILLVTALCLDAFTASLAYGAGKTKIPPVSVLVISLVCTAVLTASAGLGTAVMSVIPPGVTQVVSFTVLFVIGLVKSFEYFLKRFIAKRDNNERQLKLRLFDLNFVLTVYADAEKADIDNSKTLSVKEAVYLALALSLDGFAAGFGWGLTTINYPELIILSFLSNILAVTLGYLLGKLLTKITKIDFSWVGGVILMLLAFTKLKY
ncbi:putative sporulation protein YtaF [Sporobacter termitidis DSM 10068]|uniref:Putative sporulation protein YtaF n=1 Tax=Sporobacter termitidis DSM 10068 TaxID=1123282 RepID=A0A1M5YC59_9FIRM|nr:sporulation membrane protein YtaF [Sporobacter termitidis]SHI09499.1 putative sporulation protein YtaF [Sporobacter termitidis DSM 10068]